jgi:hypothetical protein
MRLLTLLLPTLFLISGCTRAPISVRVDTISEELLASYYVGSPDPRLYCPPTGQRLTIYWNIEKYLCAHRCFHMELTVRTCNLEEKIYTIEIPEVKGHSHLWLCNNEYTESGGLQAYKIELYGDGCLLDTWLHQLWVENITLNQNLDLDIDLEEDYNDDFDDEGTIDEPQCID